MGTFILIVTWVIELAFFVYGVATKQSHQRIKSWVRINIFIVFVVLTLSPLIVWSLSWLLLTMLLFILALRGMIALIRNKANPYQYKTSTMVWKFMMMYVALGIAITPAIMFPQYHPPEVTGKYEVETATYTYIDPNRIEEFTDKGGNRFVNVDIYYPNDADGNYPLVVFSHGAYGIKTSNFSTFIELASHGYVVVSIDHPYHSFYTISEDGRTTLVDSDFMREVSNANTADIYTMEELYDLTQKWLKLRTDDMNFVIDTILEKANSDIYQLINTEKIGVFGHSMGGSASVAVGKERMDVNAIINLDAPFFSELMYSREIDDFVAKDEAYTKPLLNIYTDDVWGQLDWNSTYVANKVTNPNFKNAYTVHFHGAKHLSLTDLPLFSPILSNLLQGEKADIDMYYCIETTNELIVKFFDFTLKGIGDFAPKATY